MRQRRPPCSRGQCLCFCVTVLSQDQPLVDRGACRLQASGDSTGGRAWSRSLPEHEVQEPEDTDKKGKPCLILFKTRSVETHFTMLVPVTRPMSTSPVIEYVAPVSAITYTAPSSVIEYVVPAPVVTNAAASSEIDYVAPVSVVFHAAPATLIERNALYTSRQEHEQHV